MGAVYFDHNATTPLDPRVLDEMMPWLRGVPSNPSSVHRFGQKAREAIEEARARVASLIGASPLEIVFTASGTEANNAVLFSSARRAGFRGSVVLTRLEHPSVSEAGEALEAAGVSVARLAPGKDGCVSAPEVLAAVGDETFLVAVMRANNEIGTLQPVDEIAAGCRERGVPVLCDAVQAIGKVPVRVEELGVDYLTIGAHKFYGPSGAAALWVRKDAHFEGLLVGGGQERRRRAGTENVAAVVGLGAAAELAERELAERAAHLASLRDGFERRLTDLEGVTIHGRESPRIPNTTHLAIAGVDAEALLIRLDLAGFAVSTGSACSSGTVEPSPMLLAMGLAPEEALASLRVSFGLTNTSEEVETFLGVLQREVAELRRHAAAVP